MTKGHLVARKTREILRLRWSAELSVRDAAGAVGVSVGVVCKLEKRASEAGLNWKRVEGMEDVELERILYGVRAGSNSDRPEPDPMWVHTELRRPGVTLELLHLEYLQEHPTGYQYTTFCGRYRRWLRSRGLSMKQVHKAGEKLFVDYSGKKPAVMDRTTGRPTSVELFVCALGASSYTYAEATRTQRVGDWIGAHVRAFEYFEGTARIWVPDQLRSAVSSPSRREPGIQRNYRDLATHYGAAAFPARPRKPKDKAKAEVGVQVVQRWILARIRNETFFSIEELNLRIRELLEDLNARPMRRFGGASRRELFERIEKNALLPLPSSPFVPSEWSAATIEPHYHVFVDNHWYSVPHQLVGEPVEIRMTGRTVEVLYRGSRCAAHARSHEPGGKTTLLEHMPDAHRSWATQDPEALMQWASEIGNGCKAMLERLIELAPNRTQGHRWGGNLRRLAEQYGAGRLERACERALQFGARSHKPIERMLKLGLEDHDQEDVSRSVPHIVHNQIRGPEYFH